MAVTPLVFLAVLLTLNVLLGPLGIGVLQWHLSPLGLNQTYGADGAVLVLVVPLALASAWLWRARNRLAAPVALGVGLASLYYAVASALGPDYVRYPGNNERFFLILLGLVIASWIIAAQAWAALDATPPVPSLWLARSLGAVLIAGGVAIGVAWSKQLLELALVGTLSGADALAYADAPSAFWLVRVVDLGFIVPISVATGIGLCRAHPIAIKMAYGIATFMTIQASSVLAMGAVMLVRQDPTATPVLLVILAPITILLAALTACLLASYASPPLPVVQRIEHGPYSGSNAPVRSESGSSTGRARQ